jgi:hypothetical protein
MERIIQDLVLTSSLHLGEGVGKFWDSDSESEFEDLGDAELPSGSPAPPLSNPPVAAPPSGSSLEPPLSFSPVAAPPPPAQRPAPSPATLSAPPHRYKPPWKSMLTVKIHQPSHEFTFGVDISFIPYPLVLTPVV